VTTVEPSLCGLENELILGTRSPRWRDQRRTLATAIVSELGKVVPCVPTHGMPPQTPSVFLGNGGRVYVDGAFLESATPEVRTPEQAVAYQRAGELLLLRSLPQAARTSRIPLNEISLTRSVTDYAGHFCGQHVNVLLRRHSAEELVGLLVPFLVTRFYAAAGGWGPTGFVMTQKTEAVRCVASPDTRTNRGIVSTRRENLASGPYRRVHLTHGDAVMSEMGTYLTVGCTMLVLKMLDECVCVGGAVKLEDPLGALRLLDRDPTWTTPLRLACGLEVSALDIQEHYLAAAERYSSRPCEHWLRETVKHWRWALDCLRASPARLARSLDPWIKMATYHRILSREGMTMREFADWCAALSVLRPHMHGTPRPERDVRGHLRDALPSVTFMLVDERVQRCGLSWSDLPRAHALWAEMLATDLRYHSIADDGLHHALLHRGAVNSRVVTDAAIAAAMTNPPGGTRAAIRGDAISKEAGRAQASWSLVVARDRQMRLDDPFAETGTWVELPRPSPRGARAVRR
jgi:hypothetical protein